MSLCDGFPHTLSVPSSSIAGLPDTAPTAQDKMGPAGGTEVSQRTHRKGEQGSETFCLLLVLGDHLHPEDLYTVCTAKP